MRPTDRRFEKILTRNFAGDFELKVCESRRLAKELVFSLSPTTLKQELLLQLGILEEHFKSTIERLRCEIERS